MRFAFLSSLILWAAGCARPPRVILPGTQYRITELDRHALTLAPPLERVAQNQPFTLQFPVTTGVNRKDCNEANDLFSIHVDHKKRLLRLDMPPLARWQLLLEDWDKVDFQAIDQKVEAIANAPETLEARGCLGSGSAVELRRVLHAAIPVRPGQDLYAAYGYRAGGLGLDLRPGVRLKVQRAHFDGEGRTINELLGTTTIYYECRADSRGRLTFSRPVVELDSTKLTSVPLDSALQAPARPLYRLFFLTSFLKKGVKRSALVLGATSVSKLQTMEHQIAANPAVSCEELDPAACISFEGDVSVSAEVRVTINGKPAWIDWGSSVSTVLRKLTAEQATGLRLRRMFQGKLVPVEADAQLTDALKNTALVAGDELSFTPLP